MRTPPDVPSRAARPRSRHLRWWIVGGVLVLIILLGSLRSLAGLYTDRLWYASVGFPRVWSTILAVKVGLFASFGAAFFVALWVNLVICDRIAAHSLPADPGDDLVRRYQRVVRPYAGRVCAVVALAVALIAAATTIGQWNNWLLFTHATPFPRKDPQFGLNDGFFVFRLPFLQFLVDWILASLVVVLVLTALFHYLNGGIRPRGTPHVSAAVKVHLSVLLALVALAKAGGYTLSRYSLDLSTNGYVEGAGYTDVHARLPALDILFFVSLFAAAILLYNIRRQGWTLPVLAIGLWGFVALVIGVIYPVVLQALKVNPAQSTLERPYIARNIRATRSAYGLTHVTVSRYKDSTQLSAPEVSANLTTLENIRLWDPAPQIAQQTFQKKQDISAYYTFGSVQVDRYTVDGKLRPVIVGVRQVDSSNLPSASWVNQHLQYTHGNGIVIAQANASTARGNPMFAIGDVPPQSSGGFPKVVQPAVYFGLTQPGYVVADTRQLELDDQRPTGTDVESHYAGSGGVRLGSFLTRAAFALRFGDLNLLLSNLITPQSKMMFVRGVRTMAEKAAPFLSFGSHPHAALVDGHIDWILNGYTTTADYPYSQNADTQQLPPGSGLPQSYNYVRNSVTVVVNAYSGKMTFYAMDDDPILRAYELAFPGMFMPASQMPPAIRAHLRYGSDIFAVQAALYGRYHITNPAQFYTAGDAWVVSPTTGVGSPNRPLAVNVVLNAQGQVISGTYQPMAPVYQVFALPGQTTQSFTITDAYVPAGGGGSNTQVLRALLIGDSNPSEYGHLHVYETPPGASKVGPILADTEIEQTTAVSGQLTLLNQHGSNVILGNVLPVPVGQSLIYVRPLYVESKTEPQPQLKYVIVVLGQNVRMRATLGAALDALLGTSLKSTGGHLSTTPNAGTARTTSPVLTPPTTGSAAAAISQARSYLAQAAKEYADAQGALKAGDLGQYQKDVATAQALAAKAAALLGGKAANGSSRGGAAESPAQRSGGAAVAPSGAGTSSKRSTPTSTGTGSPSSHPAGQSTTGSATQAKEA